VRSYGVLLPPKSHSQLASHRPVIRTCRPASRPVAPRATPPPHEPRRRPASRAAAQRSPPLPLNRARRPKIHVRHLQDEPPPQPSKTSRRRRWMQPAKKCELATLGAKLGGDPSIRKRWMRRSGRFRGISWSTIFREYSPRWMVPSLSIYKQTHAKGGPFHPIPLLVWNQTHASLSLVEDLVLHWNFGRHPTYRRSIIGIAFWTIPRGCTIGLHNQDRTSSSNFHMILQLTVKIIPQELGCFGWVAE
jgi:hypothetical protein